MVVLQTKNETVYSLVYSESVLTLDKSDKIIFIINNESEKFKFSLVFDFDDKGEPFSTTFWETPESNTLVYLLHKWESPAWVENSKPISLKGNDLDGEYLLKFRNFSSVGNSHRKFDISIWKLINTVPL